MQYLKRKERRPGLEDDGLGEEKKVIVKSEPITFGSQVEHNIKGACYNQGMTAVYVVKAALYDYFLGNLPFCPSVLTSLDVEKVKNYVLSNYQEYHYNTLSELLTYVSVKIGKNGKGICSIDASLPIIRNTEHVTRQDLGEWNMLGGGLCGPNVEHVSGLVDYVVPKADGIFVEVVALLGADKKTYSFARVGKKVFPVETSVGFSGELVGNDIVLQVGYENRSGLPYSVVIDGKECLLKMPSKISVNNIQMHAGGEGFVIGVSGIEHKVKYSNTCELKKTQKGWTTSDDVKMIVDDNENVNQGVYETVYNPTIAKYEIVKERPDKRDGQLYEKVKLINSAVKVKELVATFANIPRQEFSCVTEVLPKKEICKMVYECAHENDGHLNKKKLLTYIYGRHKFVTTSQVDAALMQLGMTQKDRFIRLVDKGEEYRDYVPQSVSRYEVLMFARNSKIRVPPYDFAVNCANFYDRRVSLHLIMNMVSTDDLMYLNNSIGAKVHGGAISNKRLSKPYCAKTVLTDNEEFVGAVVNYLRLNYGKHKAEDLYEDLVSGGGYAGDPFFVFNVLKLIIYQLGGDGPMVSIKTWKMICDIPEIMETMEVLRIRYNEVGCIGDHDERHVCSNGNAYEPSVIADCEEEFEDIVDEI